MLSRPIALVILGLLVSSLATVDVSRGLTEAVDVIVLVDPIRAGYGDRIHVTAHVFEAGSLADPSSISAVVDKLPGFASLALVRQSIGVFSGEFVFESHPSVVRVNATVRGTSDTGGATVYHESPSVRVVPSKTTSAPGERISVGVEVRDGDGSFQDADSLAVRAQVSELGGALHWRSPMNLTWTRIGVGRYSAGYTVPQDLVGDSLVEFRADVMTGSSGAGVGANVYVAFPAPFIVWYRTVAIGPTNATLVIDVASSAGVPLSNATVAIVTSPPGSGSVSREGMTNSTGSVWFDVPVASVPSDFSGTVTRGSDRQGFRGSVLLPAPPLVGPQLVRENPDEVFGAEQTAVLRFRLVRDDVPIPGQELFAYAYTNSRALLAARLSTDGEGRVEVRFIAPSGSVRLDVSGYINGTWETFHPMFYSASRVESSAVSTDGWNFRISGRFPNEPGPWLAHVGLSAAGDTVEGPWSSGGPFGSERIAGGMGASSFSVEVSLPRFLPAGLPVRVSIWAESFRGGYGESHLTIISGMPVKSPVDVAVLVVVSGLGIAVAVAASGWRLHRRPRGPS